jgi:DNA-binding XRE family transcriptional regulator
LTQNRIKNYRIENGLSQNKLAKILKIDPCTLARIEKYHSRRISKKVRIKTEFFENKRS